MSVRRSVLPLLIAAGIVGTVSPGAAEPPRTADGPNIVYTSDEGNCGVRACDREIFLAHPDGSEPTRLTDNDRHESNTSWSPDGRQILFVRSRSSRGADVWVMDADGSNARNLTNDAALEDVPRWSPDGTRIVFVRGRTHDTDFTPQIVSMNADGSNETILARDSDDPEWSPDGGLIAFRRHTSTSPVMLMQPDGANKRKLYSSAQYDWSPNGRRLALAPVGSRQVRVIDADGSNDRLLGRVRRGLSTFDLEWSPAGNRIAVGEQTDDYGLLYVADPQGGVTGVSSGDPADLDWSPSGTELVYSRCTPDCDNELRVTDLSGNDEVITTLGENYGQDLDWQPVCTVEGTEDSEPLEGTPGHDLICGFGGDDIITASGGDDVVLPGPGDDKVRGGAGEDVIADLNGVDSLFGGRGNDTLGTRDQEAGDHVTGGPGQKDVCRTDQSDVDQDCP